MLIVNSKMSPLLHKKLDYSQMFFKIGVLKNFANFTVKHLCWSLFLIKLQAKKRLQHRCCPVVFAKFLRTPLFKENLRRLLLFLLCNYSRDFTYMLDLLVPVS